MQQAFGSDNLTEYYEELRAFALGQPAYRVAPKGLMVLLDQGMPGWMGMWSRCVQPAPLKLPCSRGSPSGLLPSALRGEVTMLLTEMALSTRGR